MDISERKRSEQALARYARDLRRSNEQLEQFAYVASHDLQEPLRMITSYLQLLEARYTEHLDDDAREFIGYAVDGASRMKSLINDLLMYSRVGRGEREFATVSMDAALADARRNLQMMIEENNAEITHDPLPEVYGDAVPLSQLLQNLISNAIKFRSEAPPAIHIGVTQHSDEWMFSVRDNGIGMEPQYLERIFIIFQRLHNKQKYSGTGIGLAISKKVVEHHGGRIWAESAPGQGTTFFFTLPRKREDHRER
jgi:light-regulated signal transduction histidine kinase (bacteriophytochrome)